MSRSRRLVPPLGGDLEELATLRDESFEVGAERDPFHDATDLEGCPERGSMTALSNGAQGMGSRASIDRGLSRSRPVIQPSAPSPTAHSQS